MMSMSANLLAVPMNSAIVSSFSSPSAVRLFSTTMLPLSLRPDFSPRLLVLAVVVVLLLLLLILLLVLLLLLLPLTPTLLN